MPLNSIDKHFQAKLNVLSNMVMLKFDELLKELEVDLEPSGSKYVGCCPIHEGDNETALNIYYDGYSVPGYWKCRTKNCDKIFGKNIIGFTRGVLSVQNMNYSLEDNPKAIFPFMKTVNFLCDFVGVKFQNIKFDHKQAERASFIAECNDGSDKYTTVSYGIPRERVRGSLEIPAEYYLKRGYSKEILDRFDIGTSRTGKQETLYKVIVPIYNESEMMIGYAARSTFERCDQCRCFHNPKDSCPSSNQKLWYPKWKNIDFETKFNLYNYWGAKPHIKESNIAVLVEGPGDVWKLAENGINNAVALFGVNLSSYQQTLLARAQCMSIVCLLDTDEAGKEACKRIKEEYGRLFRMYFPKFNAHDIGEMNTDAITTEIKPLLRSLESL